MALSNAQIEIMNLLKITRDEIGKRTHMSVATTEIATVQALVDRGLAKWYTVYDAELKRRIPYFYSARLLEKGNRVAEEMGLGTGWFEADRAGWMAHKLAA